MFIDQEKGTEAGQGSGQSAVPLIGQIGPDPRPCLWQPPLPDRLTSDGNDDQRADEADAI